MSSRGLSPGSLFRHGVSVEGGGHRRGRPGNSEGYGRDGPAVLRGLVQCHEEEDRRYRAHGVGDGQDEGDPHCGPQAGHHADADADKHPHENGRDVLPGKQRQEIECKYIHGFHPSSEPEVQDPAEHKVHEQRDKRPCRQCGEDSFRDAFFRVQEEEHHDHHAK